MKQTHEAPYQNNEKLTSWKQLVRHQLGRLASAIVRRGESETAQPEFVNDKETKLAKHTIDGIDYLSNSSDSVYLFKGTVEGEEALHPYNRTVDPRVLDTIPAGEYIIGHPDMTEEDETDSRTKVRVITDFPDGRRVNRIENSYGLVKNWGHSEALMTQLGYMYEERTLDEGLDTESIDYGAPVAVPTPNTIRDKAKQLGVEIQFFPDQGIIAGTDYRNAFKDEKFPVSTMTQEEFIHDTTDDHLTAMVLGADALKIALRDSAINSEATNQDANDWAKSTDDFTAFLRGVISPTMNGAGRDYSMRYLRVFGNQIGLSEEIVNEIVETARDNARKYGMTINELVTA